MCRRGYIVFGKTDWPKAVFFCRNVFVIIFGASGPGVRSIQNIAQWDVDFSCVGIVKEIEPCDQSAVSEERPLELLQKCSDTYPGSAPNLAALRWTPSSL